MRVFIFILGLLLTASSLFFLLQYGLNYGQFSEYGKGFFWGKVVMMLAGVGLLLASRRRRKG